MTSRERLLGAVTVVVALGAGLLSLDSESPGRGGDKAGKPRAAPARLATAGATPAAAREELNLEAMRLALATRPQTPWPAEQQGPADPFEPRLPKRPEPAPRLPESLPGPEPAPRRQFQFQGVYLGGGLQAGIVDGRTVRIGDRLEDLTIREIRREGLVCDCDGRRYLLSFRGLEPF